ncbi:hypothetical protein [Blastococcus sp. SYSU D00695]
MQWDERDARALADLEQELMEPAVRRFRRRWWAGTAAAGVLAAGALAVLGPAAFPLLLVAMLTGGLLLVAGISEPPAVPRDGEQAAPAGRATPPAAPRRRAATAQRRRARHQPRGCSTKS